MEKDYLGTFEKIHTGSGEVGVCSLARLEQVAGVDVSRLPRTVRILIENLLRRAGSRDVAAEDVVALAGWPERTPGTSIAFMPSRVLMQDFTGVPAVVDLAALRDAVAAAGGDPKKVDPFVPVDLVIDHSIQVDRFGSPDAYAANLDWEYRRNRERYGLLNWAQQAFRRFRVVPPGMGICHQVNLEYLSQVVTYEKGLAFPETLIGTDSHTTMINGLGVLGWGVGGIEAEAAMLRQPIFLQWPQVLGIRTKGALPPGTTATDLVLTLAEMLRAKGVVGKFVEFFGPGLSSLSVADRATISNMSPEFGATATYFPVDANTLEYLEITGRGAAAALADGYTKHQGLFRTDSESDPIFDEILDLDLALVEPSLAGPTRPQDRVSLAEVKQSFARALAGWIPAPAETEISRLVAEGGNPPGQDLQAPLTGTPGASDSGPAPHASETQLEHGSVVIAAITSCTNTSNPSVMIAAGLLAKKAVDAGLAVKPWVKTSLAPGSRVVTSYLEAAGLMPYLDKLGFSLVGYGCTTCIGNSGPLPDKVSEAVDSRRLAVAAVLSGNRNFEGRIHPQVKASYLASPPLCIAYALAGTVDIDLTRQPLGIDQQGSHVYLKDIWPDGKEIEEMMAASISASQFAQEYAGIFDGDERWRSMPAPSGDLFQWDPVSTYIRLPPYFTSVEVAGPAQISGARALVVLGDSVTTDHISPAGAIRVDSPAGKYLTSLGVQPANFNSYGARRGNHQVMLRGTFANLRLKNALAAGRVGPWTVHFPGKEELSIYDAAMAYRTEGVPVIVIAGKEYGSGSSRDWAAKGPALLGVRAVIAESFERIHRSNLVQMGVLPLEFEPGSSAQSLGMDGTEAYAVEVSSAPIPGESVRVRAVREDGSETTFLTKLRIDNAAEAEYYIGGGILQMVRRQLLEK